ncbi:MAG: aminotransferase class I/II-fold pyridoxal phosphate-dependent enzyme, partial [Ktedonobacterales bacterium]
MSTEGETMPGTMARDTPSESACERASATAESAAGGDFACVVDALCGFRARTGEAPLMLGGWEAEDPTIAPPAPLVAALQAIPPRLGGYTFARDLGRARERAAALFAPDVTIGGEPPTRDTVALLQNGTQGLLLALAALKEHGVRRVVIAAPCYFAAVEVCRQLGLRTEVVPAADYLTGTLDLDRLAAQAGRSHSALLLTNPAYSLGVEYPAAQLAALYAALPATTFVLLDETRLGLHWQREAPWARAAYPARALVLRSPSKIFFINGLKSGVLFGATDLVRSVERLGEALVGSYQGNAEAVALAYLLAWQAWRDEVTGAQYGPYRAWRHGVVGALRHNRDALVPVLAARGFVLSPT